MSGGRGMKLNRRAREALEALVAGAVVQAEDPVAERVYLSANLAMWREVLAVLDQIDKRTAPSGCTAGRTPKGMATEVPRH